MVTTTSTNTTIIIITLINIFHTNWYILKESKRNKLLKPISQCLRNGSLLGFNVNIGIYKVKVNRK